MKNLIKKEIKEFYQKEPLSLGVSIAILSFILSTIFPSFQNFKNPTISESLSIIFPIAIIILASDFHLVRQFYKDRIEGKIEILMCMGYSPVRIWLGKSIVLCLMLYLIFIVSVSLAILVSLLRGIKVFWLGWSNLAIWSFFFVAPLSALSFSAFQGFLLFFTKNVAVVRAFFFIIFIGVFFALGKLKIIIFNLNIDLGISIIILSIIFLLGFLVPGLILKNLRKDIFLN